MGSLVLPLDYFAVTLLVGAQLGIGWRVETLSPDNQSVTITMDDFLRDWMRDWMREMETRQSRKSLCILFSGYYIFTECCGKQSLTYKMLIAAEQNA